MSRLRTRINEFCIVNEDGKVRLCEAVRKSERQVERYLNGEAIPPRHIRYQLALACGCTHEEALELAQELPKAEGKAS